MSHGESCSEINSNAPSYFSRIQFRLEWILAVMRVSGDFDDCNPFCKKENTRRLYKPHKDSSGEEEEEEEEEDRDDLNF